ncbi:MAG TPA: VIT1/CCC1 transporter family protein [Candidatus Limnocylindrales bacterium]|nr:VIT1/CCC1 transporter family protein [Candidatus Limnocylindrales bacterium]
MTTEPADVRTGAPRRDVRTSIQAVLADGASLRSWTGVANDGIIATAGILEGFAGAGATDRALLIAATVATVTGMLAAGGAKWAEIDSEREAHLKAATDEAASLAAEPEAELAELTAYYEAKGLSAEMASAVAAELTAHNALAAQLESEHGILRVITRADAIVAGLGASIAYLLGAAIPLLITLFAPVAIEPLAIILAVAASLIVTSVVGARTGHMHVGRTVARTLAVGFGTLTISYALGQLIF